MTKTIDKVQRTTTTARPFIRKIQGKDHEKLHAHSHTTACHHRLRKC